MKICIVIIGAIRLDSDVILNNINDITSQFENHEYTVIFVTWEPIVKTYMTHNVNYYYDYDKKTLIEKIGNRVDTLLFMNNLDITNVVKLKNGMPPLFMYQLNYAKEFIINNNLSFDYIVKIRNDVKIKFNDVAKFLDDKVYIPPAYWRPHEMYKPLNDHMFIMPFILFKQIDISEKNIINMTQQCHDCEELNYKLIKPNVVIDNTFIKLYKTYGGAKISIEN